MGNIITFLTHHINPPLILINLPTELTNEAMIERIYISNRNCNKLR